MDGTLRDKLKEGPLSVKEALKIVLNVAMALEYAHKEFALVHRDIKPENVLFKGEVYKLSDWGLASVQTMLTASGYTGTIFYSAPEQFDKSFGSISFWTDVWQLGAMFYEMITGELPFGKELGEVIKNVLYGEPKKPEGIDKEVWELIKAMLNKKPSERITLSELIFRIKELIEKL